MQTLVFIDCETTGLHRGRRAWEVAMIRRALDRDGEIKQAELSVFIDDMDLSGADPAALAVGRFYERHPRYDPKHLGSPAAHPYLWYGQKVAHRIEEWTRGATLIGSNPSFDAETLDGMLRRYRLLPAWHYRVVDAVDLAVGWITREMSTCPIDDLTPPWDSRQIVSLMEDMTGRKIASLEQDQHTALGDARWAMRLYDAVMGG